MANSLASGTSLADAQLESTALLDEDRQLRAAGYPQFLLYSLRAAGLSKTAIEQLPKPVAGGDGLVPDSYWENLRAHGVPSSALPDRFRSAANPTRAEADLLTYTSLASRSFRTVFAPHTSAAAAPMSFGSPVRTLPSSSARAALHFTPIAGSQSSMFASNPMGASSSHMSTVGSASMRSSSQMQNTGSIFTAPSFATPMGAQPPPPPNHVDYLKHVDYAIPLANWPRIRDGLISSGTCDVHHAFSIQDKQFQTLVTSVKVPTSFYKVGSNGFSMEAWRDMHDYLESVDAWYAFCAIVTGNFRAVLDGVDSLSMAGTEIVRIIEEAPKVRFVGHSYLTAALSQWHATFVLSSKTLVWANLSSLIMRDRLLWPAILQAINPEAKQHIRSTFPRNDGMFATFCTALHSWRFKVEDVWNALFELDAHLSSKKPRDITIRDWKAQMDRWRLERRHLSNGNDIDGDSEHIWLMRCLETCSNEKWFPKFRREMAWDEERGFFILSADDLWRKMEFEETYSPSLRVNAIEEDHHSLERYEPYDNTKPYDRPKYDRGRGYDKGGRGGRGGRAGGRGGARGRDKYGKGASGGSGSRMWSAIGFAADHPNPKPNDPWWRCRGCKENPCRGFCQKCLLSCHESHRPTCPYSTGDKVPPKWDFSRPCIRCRRPQANHYPWKCPVAKTVHIVNRQYPPRVLVDYDRSYHRRVSHVGSDCDYADDYADYTEFGDYDDSHQSGGGIDEESQDYFPHDTHEDDELDAHSRIVNAIACESYTPPDFEPSPSIDNSANITHVSFSESPPQPAGSPMQSGGKIDTDKLVSFIRESVESKFRRVTMLHIIVNMLEKSEELKGAILFDSGSQANIKNDIKCFVDYLEPSNVTLGTTTSGATLRNCGVGTRERRFRDTDGNVYVHRDRAFYCPDAAYPIVSSGDWERRGASILLNPTHFEKTKGGRAIPQDAPALIIDASERMLVLRPVPGIQALHWLVPIQHTSIEDIESKRFLERNRSFSTNLLTRLNEEAEAPTVAEYASKVQTLQQQLEEAHLLHSQLYGVSDENVTRLIASAYECISSIPTSSRTSHTGFDTYEGLGDGVPTIDPARVNMVCTRCRERGHGVDTCMSACAICLSPHGHAHGCDFENMVAPPMVNVLEERLPVTRDSDALMDTGVSVNYVPLFYAAANSLELRPIIAAIQDLSQSCASLDIVQASVMATLDYNPNWPPSMAVRQAICNLAASEHTDEVASERTVQAALERIEQAALERTEQAALERTDQVASERTDQAASERNTQGDSHMR